MIRTITKTLINNPNTEPIIPILARRLPNNKPATPPSSMLFAKLPLLKEFGLDAWALLVVDFFWLKVAELFELVPVLELNDFLPERYDFALTSCEVFTNVLSAIGAATNVNSMKDARIFVTKLFLPKMIPPVNSSNNWLFTCYYTIYDCFAKRFHIKNKINFFFSLFIIWQEGGCSNV